MPQQAKSSSYVELSANLFTADFRHKNATYLPNTAGILKCYGISYDQSIIFTQVKQ